MTTLVLHFSPEWSDFSKRILWKDSRGQKVVSVVLTPVINKDTAAGYPMEYHTEIPYEALAYTGWCSFIAEGFLPNDTAKVAKSVTARMYVQENEAEGDTPENTPAPTPSEIQQLQAAVNNAIGVAAADKAAAEQAAENAQLSASAASVNARVAEDAAENASASANSASNFKSVAEQASARAVEAFTGAANAKSAAENAKAAAEGAKTAAESAKTLAESAKAQANTSAQNASASASAAAASEETASSAAETAINAAEFAEQAAQTIGNIGQAASESADSARDSATAAKAQANAASTSAQNAQTAADSAESAAEEANAAVNMTAANAAAAEDAASAAMAAQRGAAEARDEAQRQVQADLSENDTTKASHVLGRTHWKEVEENAVLFEKTDLAYNQNYFHPERIGLEAGGVYTLTVNGDAYEMIGVHYYDYGSAAPSGTILVLNDGRVRDQYNVGIPIFFVDNNAAAAASDGYGAVVRTEYDGENQSLTLTGDRTTWHPLDPNYVDFVLKSPGGKKFRVTVSDSGALSAVEVAE